MINIGIPLAICLILIVSLVFLGSNITQKTNQIKKQRGELLFRLQSTESLASLSKDFEKAQNYSIQLETILPNRDKLVTFPRNISVIANQSQIDLNSTLGKESSENQDGLGQTDFTMSGQGDFDNFINFLKSIENGLYLLKFKGIDLTRQGESFKILLTGQVFSK